MQKLQNGTGPAGICLAGDQANKIAGDSEARVHYKKAISAHEEIFGDQLNDFDKAVYTRKLGEIYFRRGEHDKALESFKKAFNLLGMAYPFTVLQTRTAIFKQMVYQCFHRIGAGLFKNRAGPGKPNAYDREVTRIFETMAWIDFFINQERLALDLISLLNYAEKIHYHNKMSQAYSGFGLLLDTLGWFSLAGYYHELSRRFTGPATDGLTLASACVCRAIHLDYTGQWDQALAQYETAANLYEKIGHIKKWGSPISLMSFIYNHRGEFYKSREYAQKLIQIGVESGDLQLKGWGLGAKAFYQIRNGGFEAAARDLRQAKTLLESIPDYYALVAVHVDRISCYLCMGDYHKAHAAVTAAGKLVAEKHLKGVILSLFYNAACEFYLTVYEKFIQIEEKVTLRKIKKYAAQSLRHGSRFKCGLPKACRLNGWFCSLAGNSQKACDFWLQGIEAARGLGAAFEEGMINFEMGRHLDDIDCLKSAGSIFETINAKAELLRVNTQITVVEKGHHPIDHAK